ncbi:MAG: helix-turn-helix domain-containing protein [Chloroflexota bacterium]|nr:helix-turn-helix domain-containing protein [Chloroflexota bacterium]
MTDNNRTEETLSPTQAAAIVGVTETTLRRWLIANKIPSFKVGSSRRIRRGDLEEAMKPGKTGGKGSS